MMELMAGKSGLMVPILLAALSGLSIRVMLTIVKQKWASTYHHTMSYILLPLITFTITKVISGNIALSLGMIGALSIVRFRNPVKNPFELVMFFALVTIGISMAAKLEYGIMLTVIVDVVIIGSYFIEKISQKLGYHIYSLSFDEGNSFDILEVTANSDIPELTKSEHLLQHVFDKSTNTRHYRLASRSNNEKLDKLRERLEKNDAVLHIDSRYS